MIKGARKFVDVDKYGIYVVRCKSCKREINGFETDIKE